MDDLSALLEGLSPEDILRELDRLDYEQDFYSFFRAGWKYIDPSPFVDGLPLEAVCEHLEAVVKGDIRRLIINIPPRMSKSSMTSVSLPAWTWCRRWETPTSGPGVQFLHASYSQSLSLRDSVKCRRLIESTWYKSLWSDRFRLTGDQNTKTRFDNSRNGSRLCTSVGSTLTGEGGNIIVVDDPNAAQEAFSEATIETTIEWWDTALSTRLNDPKTGAFIVIQQRLAENDLTGHILEKDIGEWIHLMLPMRYESDRAELIYPNKIGWMDWRKDEGELLWPERFGEDEILTLEATLGPYGAAGQLQQRPEVKGGGIIKREWWQLWEGKSAPQLDYVLASLDCAYTEKEENDPSAMTIWGIFSDDNIADIRDLRLRDGEVLNFKRTFRQPHPKAILLYAWTGRYEISDLVKKIGEDCKRHRVDKIIVESKATGQSVAQELRRIYSDEDWSVQLLDPGSQDKMARLYSVQHLFSGDRVTKIDPDTGFMVDGWQGGLVYAPDRPWADAVITQCATFPKAKHDDLVDTVSQAMRYFRAMGMLRRTEEIHHDLRESLRHKGAPPPPLYPGM